MIATTAQTPPSAGGRPGTVPMLIDTDVHENLRSKLDLLPYMDDYWQHYMQTYQVDTRPSFPSDFPYSAMLTSRGREEWTSEDGSIGLDVAAMQKHLLEDEGVSIALLNGQFYPSFLNGNYEFAIALARAYNDWQIDQWLEKEPRLRGAVQVVAHDPQEAAREIDRVAEHPQVVQVMLPFTQERQYGDPRYFPIYEAARRNGLVVSMHHLQNTKTPLGYPRYWLEWHTMCAPHAAMNQLASILANGVLEEHEGLKVVLLETGVGWLNWFMDRADQVWEATKSQSPRITRRPSELIRESVRLSTQPMGDTTPKGFTALMDRADTHEVFMFSSDYPHFDADSLNVYDRLADDVRRRLSYENALNTYPRLEGLKP